MRERTLLNTSFSEDSNRPGFITNIKIKSFYEDGCKEYEKNNKTIYLSTTYKFPIDVIFVSCVEIT